MYALFERLFLPIIHTQKRHQDHLLSIAAECHFHYPSVVSLTRSTLGSHFLVVSD